MLLLCFMVWTCLSSGCVCCQPACPGSLGGSHFLSDPAPTFFINCSVFCHRWLLTPHTHKTNKSPSRLWILLLAFPPSGNNFPYIALNLHILSRILMWAHGRPALKPHASRGGERKNPPPHPHYLQFKTSTSLRNWWVHLLLLLLLRHSKMKLSNTSRVALNKDESQSFAVAL